MEQAKILFAFVCKYETRSNQARVLVESKEVLEGFVRGLWEQGQLTGPPSRPTDREQLRGECGNTVQALPRLLAFDVQEDWSIPCWEAGIPRVATGVKNRVDRLKCLGNAIVPQVAYEIIRVVKETDET